METENVGKNYISRHEGSPPPPPLQNKSTARILKYLDKVNFAKVSRLKSCLKGKVPLLCLSCENISFRFDLNLFL